MLCLRLSAKATPFHGVWSLPALGVTHLLRRGRRYEEAGGDGGDGWSHSSVCLLGTMMLAEPVRGTICRGLFSTLRVVRVWKLRGCVRSVWFQRGMNIDGGVGTSSTTSTVNFFPLCFFSSFQFFTHLQAHKLLWGNLYLPVGFSRACISHSGNSC